VEHATAGDKDHGRSTVSPSRGVRYAVGLLATVVAFVLYLRTLAPTVLYYDYPAMRDASAFQVKAYIMGIPDVTGYPTYTMLTHLFTYLPFGDPAYRVNLASAVYAAGTIFLVYLVCLHLTRRIAPSVAGALLFGTSETFWSQAVIAEVYTLNTVFIAAIVLALLVWRDRRMDRYLLLAAFLTGLSLTHHLTCGLLLPASLLFVLMVDRSKLYDKGLVLKGTVLFSLGLLPYLYLPVRASMDFTRWTISVDPTLVRYDTSTLSGLFDLVTGGDFKGAMLAFGPAELPARAVYYLGCLLEQFYPAFISVALLGVALVGVVHLLIEDRAVIVLLGFLYLGWLFYALEYDISDIYYYFIPTYLILAVFAAVGLAAFLRIAEKLMAGQSARVRTVVAALAVVSLTLAPFAGVAATYAEVDRSEDYEGRKAIETVATKTEPDATVIHHRSPLWYMNLVEGRRRDIRLVASFHLTLEDREIEATKAALTTGSVYMLYPSMANARLMKNAGLYLVPVETGMLYKVEPRDGDGLETICNSYSTIFFEEGDGVNLDSSPRL